MGPFVKKNSQNWQMSFTHLLLSTSRRNKRSIFWVTTWVLRPHAAKWQSAGQRSLGILWGQRDCISSSHPRSSQHFAILVPFSIFNVCLHLNAFTQPRRQQISKENVLGVLCHEFVSQMPGFFYEIVRHPACTAYLSCLSRLPRLFINRPAIFPTTFAKHITGKYKK